ncbi:MAG: tRNA lysidine(34) synthetase TilS [Bdellovibrio sp.]|nr:tRNA lysidine(34) synthetase TilS [Bdellovibrio sp.]
MKLTHDFEHQIWKLLKDHHLDEVPSYVLAVSGGLDSMALMHVMSVVRPQAILKVLHYHHGDSPELNNFRKESLIFVKQQAKAIKNAKFVSAKSSHPLNSEAEMRDARWSFLRQNREENEAIVTAHHMDDWVETLALKLIRGVSETGFLAFQVWNHEIFRPFLNKNKSELREYAEARNLKWIEDPSNSKDHYLRNWLRETWFKDLEKKVPGAYHNFSRSLLHLVSELSLENSFELHYFGENADDGLDRAWYLGLSEKDQLKALALFLQTSGTQEMSRGQLEEIRKRLDKNQKDLTFEIIRKWVINAKQIMLK